MRSASVQQPVAQPQPPLLQPPEARRAESGSVAISWDATAPATKTAEAAAEEEAAEKYEETG